jgi:hypothetical protein
MQATSDNQGKNVTQMKPYYSSFPKGLFLYYRCDVHFCKDYRQILSRLVVTFLFVALTL